MKKLLWVPLIFVASLAFGQGAMLTAFRHRAARPPTSRCMDRLALNDGLAGTCLYPRAVLVYIDPETPLAKDVEMGSTNNLLIVLKVVNATDKTLHLSEITVQDNLQNFSVLTWMFGSITVRDEKGTTIASGGGWPGSTDVVYFLRPEEAIDFPPGATIRLFFYGDVPPASVLTSKAEGTRHIFSPSPFFPMMAWEYPLVLNTPEKGNPITIVRPQ